ncbi:MFS transporter [Corynebacterium sp. TAE3-ERU16]|uniref:MFS transporter n=1 Tax=Corynebacterium sp. TAE3-ERU16 TaxID=2849493 RepID=UPI001C44E640|nr:MFS transporter [Corynebacterium sp. TAE3-ERU16]MBV7292920.1 MFS transporter [Corynebacterium sp. TAE3-ERU16]
MSRIIPRNGSSALAQSMTAATARLRSRYQNFREVANKPGLKTLIIWSFPARLHLSASVVALLLVASDELSSVAAAGTVTGLFVLGQGASGPLRGRMIDRHNAATPLVVFSGIYGTGLTALAYLPLHSVSTLGFAAFATGLLCPPTTQAVRAKIGQLIPAEHRKQAFSLQSVVNELVLVSGPGLVAFAVLVHGPGLALAACGAVAVVGGTGLAAACVRVGVNYPPEIGEQQTSPRRLNAGVWALIGVVAVLIAAFTMVDLTLVLWSRATGNPELGGVLIAVWAIGSVIGGISGSTDTGTALLWTKVAGIAATTMPLAILWAVVDSPQTLVIAVILLINGYTIPTTLAALYSRISEFSGNSAGSAFGWQAAACTASGAAANTAGGVIFESVGAVGGASFAVACTTVAAVVLVLLELAGKGAAPGV